MALNPYTNTPYTPENIEGMVFFSTLTGLFYFIEGGKIFYTESDHNYGTESIHILEQMCEALNLDIGYRIPIYCPDES